MDLAINEMQEMLKRTAREFFEKECPSSLVRAVEQEPNGYSRDLWQKMASQGWMGMAVPSPYGGSGTSFLDLCVLVEETGRSLAPGPFIDTALSAYLLADAGSEEQKQRWLPAIARGELISTVAFTEPSASYDPKEIKLSAKPDGDGYLLNGTKLFVSNAHIADLLLVVARTGASGGEGLTIFAVPGSRTGVRTRVLDTLSSDRLAEVVFDNVRLGASDVVGPVNGAWPAVDRYLGKARVLTCVWSVGGAEYVLEITVEYAKNRVAFGRPIGAFQAISHKCADMAMDCDGMRFVSYNAAWRISEGLPADQEIAVAKAWCGEAYRRVTASGNQVHGGIAFMMEHNMQLYFRRAKAAELLYGDGDYHRERVAVGMGL